MQRSGVVTCGRRPEKWKIPRRWARKQALPQPGFGHAWFSLFPLHVEVSGCVVLVGFAEDRGPFGSGLRQS